ARRVAIAAGSSPSGSGVMESQSSRCAVICRYDIMLLTTKSAQAGATHDPGSDRGTNREPERLCAAPTAGPRSDALHRPPGAEARAQHHLSADRKSRRVGKE